MIYIIGVNHICQWNRRHGLTELLIRYLSDITERLEISIVAEEWSNEATAANLVDSSVIEDFAHSNNLVYLACDPTKEERQKIGIRSREDIINEAWKYSNQPYSPSRSRLLQIEISKDHPKRENFWLQKIEPHIAKNIVFVCGSEHVSTLSKLGNKGFDSILALHKIDHKVMDEHFDQI